MKIILNADELKLVAELARDNADYVLTKLPLVYEANLTDDVDWVLEMLAEDSADV